METLTVILNTSYSKFRYNKELSKFLFQCISEGLIPKGMMTKFSLANFVNDHSLVEQITGIINEKSSRILDAIAKRVEIETVEWENKFDDAKVKLIDHFS